MERARSILTPQNLPPVPPVEVHIASPDAIQAANGQPPEAPTQVTEIAERGRLYKAGQAVKARALTEIAGVGVDVALMAAGIPLVAREPLASTGDVAIFNRLAPHERNRNQSLPTPLRRLSHYAITMAVAMAAQKVGPGLIEHLSTNINQGMGHFAVPLTSKVGATAGVNSLFKRAAR